MKYFSKHKQTSDTFFTIKNVKVEFPFYIFVTFDLTNEIKKKTSKNKHNIRYPLDHQEF